MLIRIANYNGVDVKADQLKFDEDDRSESEIQELDPQMKESESKTRVEAKPKHCKGTITQMLEDKPLFINLIKVTLLWGLIQFNFFMKNFLMKYLPGSIFFNMTISAISEMMGIITIICLQSYFINKRHLLMLFTAITTLGAMLLFMNLEESEFYTNWVIPAALLFASYGLVSTLCVLWISNNELFPTVFSTTTLGYCNLFGRFCAIFGPMVAELPTPIPQRTLFVLSLLATGLTFFIDEKTKAYY